MYDVDGAFLVEPLILHNKIIAERLKVQCILAGVKLSGRVTLVDFSGLMWDHPTYYDIMHVRKI